MTKLSNAKRWAKSLPNWWRRCICPEIMVRYFIQTVSEVTRLFGWFRLIVVIKLRIFFVFDEDWLSARWWRKEHHNFDSYLGFQDHLVSFDPVLVDCRNEIMCFGCVFVNTVVETNLTALAGYLWWRYCLRRSGPDSVDFCN